MESILFYGAIDVDDKNFHLGIYDCLTQEVTTFRCNPTSSDLIKLLVRKGFRLSSLKICYEASYFGHHLCRELRNQGLACEIIAPSLIPTLRGKPIKTDRLDCINLATYYAHGLLKPVREISLEDEETRSLIRSRQFTVEQMKKNKTHLIYLCRRQGWHYRQDVEKPTAQYFTQPHCKWLDKKLNALSEDSILRWNLSMLINQHHHYENLIKLYDQKIDQLASTPAYAKKVNSLNCFRGIKTLTAMTLILEIGDIYRFNHPKRLVSYAGMGIKEYSSGGKEYKFQITKMGNPYIRTAVIESAQYALKTPYVSRLLKVRRQQGNPEAINIADRCMHRLHEKALPMIRHGKNRNKIKVACAREMLCFIWEVLKTAA